MGFGKEGSCTNTLVPNRSVGSGSNCATVVPVARFVPNNEVSAPGQRFPLNEAPFKTPVTLGVACADASRGRVRTART